MQAREGPGPARQLLRPGREKLAARIRRQCRRRKRGPRPKTATVERREARVPPALRDAGTPLGARPAALWQGTRRRGNEWCCPKWAESVGLFEIVRRVGERPRPPCKLSPPTAPRSRCAPAR